MKSYKDQIKDTFKQTKEVSCPAFGGNKIYFNAKGINHLLYNEYPFVTKGDKGFTSNAVFSGREQLQKRSGN